MRPTYLAGVAAVALLSAAALGCSKKRESYSAAGAQDTSSTPTAAAAATPSGVTAVRGRVVSVSDSVLTVASPNGDVRVALAPPLQVYSREPADLSRVTEGSFVGVTSMPQPDGSQRATEIHIFPEELRGTNEGSFLMGQQGARGNLSTMTNGTVSGPRMTNGAASRMTNGRVGARAGQTLTVSYRGGSQTIAIPPGVTVTAIAPTQTKLSAGANVVVLATKQSDGTLRASRVLLAGR